MNCTLLLQKLIGIERSIGKVDCTTLRAMVLEAQEFVLQMQKERAETLIHRSYREIRGAF